MKAIREKAYSSSQILNWDLVREQSPQHNAAIIVIYRGYGALDEQSLGFSMKPSMTNSYNQGMVALTWSRDIEIFTVYFLSETVKV